MRQRYDCSGSMPKNVMVVSAAPTNEFSTVFVEIAEMETEKNCGRRGPEVSERTTETAADDDDSNTTVASTITLYK